MSDPSSIVTRLVERGETVSCAESLTGGLLVARLIDVPGASAAVRGGVVAYATPLKTALLGVPADLLASRGAVDADVARAMSSGVRERLETTWGLATTGVAGPLPQDGQEVGTVFVAVCGPTGAHHAVVRRLSLPGDRGEVRRAAVDAALTLLSDLLGSK